MQQRHATAQDLVDHKAPPERISQARLKELAAVKQYNDFLDTAKQDYAKATQYEARLRNDPSLSSLERHQLEVTRDALNARAGEFQQFANDNKLFPQSANPVKLDGKIYYDNGHTEWDTSTARGILGSAIDSGKSVFSAGLEWITPSNATNQLACAEGFNSLVGVVTGKVLSNPGGAANPAAEKALEEIWGQGKGGVMKPGDAIFRVPIGIVMLASNSPSTAPFSRYRLYRLGDDPIRGRGRHQAERPFPAGKCKKLQ
ncbi:hypothetical protein CNECB9_5410016 [Cupriavidus necator]|uniref:Uncharacterized protein n=2 Tax=Cupriavidus necator TaxID=106590 RepID=A0A1K0JP62_CUPNE|nr:hypothetical protein CNECB9_5410016 [Cupriavidus necator]